MRRTHLIAAPTALLLLGCTGLCSGVLEKLGLGDKIPGLSGGAPDGFECPGKAKLGGGAFPEAGGSWWKLADDSAHFSEIKNAWSFPLREDMTEGDSHWFCDDAGTWSGPYRQERGAGWLSGYFDDGQPHGTWRGGGGGAVGEDLAFEGHYADGAREGDWTFYTDGDAVAEGSYRDGLAHGDWRFSGDKSIDAHYVWGTLHGPWRAAGPADGASERGFYFHGKKHGVWTQGAEVSGQVKEIKRTVWSMGEILDDDADDPLAGEGGARAAMDAYLEADAKGGRLSTDNLVSYPVLTDFADKDRFEEGEDAYEKAIILSNYEIDEIRMDGTTAKVVVTLHQTCEVVAGDTAKAKKADISVEYTLKQQDGFWRIDTPITEPHPFPGAYMEAIGGRSSELGKSIMETCLTKGTIKDGKAASGKASKGGGKINKGKGGNKINKGKGGKRGR